MFLKFLYLAHKANAGGGPVTSSDWSDQSDIITAPSRRPWDMQLTSPLMLLVHECRERGTVFFVLKLQYLQLCGKKYGKYLSFVVTLLKFRYNCFSS